MIISQISIPIPQNYLCFTSKPNRQLSIRICFSVEKFATCSYDFVLLHRRVRENNNLKVKSRIKLHIKQQELKPKNYIFQQIDQTLRSKNSHITFLNINQLCIINPSKREGEIMKCFIDSSGNIVSDPNAINTYCLQHLSKLSLKLNLYDQYLFRIRIFPNLQPLQTDQATRLQSLLSYNKAITYDGFVDEWLKYTKKLILLQNFWNNQTMHALGEKIFQARLIPLNKNYPNIPTAEAFRPIVILSPLLKFLNLRFLSKILGFINNKLDKNQIGFIQSTQLNILQLAQVFQKYPPSERMCLIFIDFQSAYNLIN
ncbi:hypothetical protein ABPG72_010390 [Tetrahymena utriculariae]